MVTAAPVLGPVVTPSDELLPISWNVPLLAKVLPAGVMVIVDPLSNSTLPALLVRPVSALSLLMLPATATNALAPLTMRVPLAAMEVIAPLANSRSALPLTSILPVRMLGAAPPVMFSVPLPLAPACAGPFTTMVPVFTRDCAVTVTGASEPPKGILPMAMVPLLVSVPAMLRALPPVLKNSEKLSTLSVPVLMKLPLTDMAAPDEVPRKDTVPALLTSWVTASEEPEIELQGGIGVVEGERIRRRAGAGQLDRVGAGYTDERIGR